MLMWWKRGVNRSVFLSLATFRMRSSACDTLIRLRARHVLCWSAFPLVSALGSTGSAVAGSAADCSTAGRATLFAGFAATMALSDEVAEIVNRRQPMPRRAFDNHAAMRQPPI